MGKALHDMLKELLEELEAMRPDFSKLSKENRLLAELVLAKKEAILKVAQDLIEDDGGVL